MNSENGTTQHEAAPSAANMPPAARTFWAVPPAA
jgi:hypothetical protein